METFGVSCKWHLLYNRNPEPDLDPAGHLLPRTPSNTLLLHAALWKCNQALKPCPGTVPELKCLVGQ